MSDLIPIVVAGSGGLAREVIGTLQAVNEEAAEFLVVGVLADNPVELPRYERIGVPILGSTDAAAGIAARFVVAIGDPAIKWRVIEWLMSAGLSPAPPVVHPTASVGPDVEIGVGSVIQSGAQLTTNIRIGMHAQINPNVVISHDATVGDLTTISPMVAVTGNVIIEERVNIGAGPTILPGIRLGKGSIIGAGAVVTNDVYPGTTVAGVPARVMGEER